ncbi:MAG: hypothetical protein WBE89_09415 [Methyloceanibacter sp.]
MVIAIFAALCFVAPPAVMAFGHGGNIVHCLTHGDAVDHGVHDGAGQTRTMAVAPSFRATMARIAAGCSS